jgi:hypothetical protein
MAACRADVERLGVPTWRPPDFEPSLYANLFSPSSHNVCLQNSMQRLVVRQLIGNMFYWLIDGSEGPSSLIFRKMPVNFPTREVPKTPKSLFAALRRSSFTNRADQIFGTSWKFK